MTQAKVPTGAKWGMGIMLVIIVALCLVALSKPKVNLDGYISEDDSQSAVNKAVAAANAAKDLEIAALQQEEVIPFEDEEEVVEEAVGYLIDELFLAVQFVEDTYSDRELNLFDGEVEFDGEEYDAEETLVLKDFELLANENDFEGNVYLTVPAGSVAYSLVFDSELDTGLINEDETLSFNFLGKGYEVSEWDVDKVSFTTGKEHYLSEGDSAVVGEKTVVLDMVLDDAVYVTVDGVGEKILESKTRNVNGLEIRAKEVLYSAKDSRVSKAILVIGEEVEVTVDSGDEYEEDGAWEWVIDSNSIGLVLVEAFTEIDEDGDEDFPAIGSGEALCLPEEYVCIQFNGLADEDEEEYSLELDEKDGTKVRIEGNFLSGLEDYDRVYLNGTGIYDRDLELIDANFVELGDTESVLNISAGSITIGDFNVNFDLNASNVGDDEEDYLTDYGILVVNPEESVEDQEYLITVPEEQLEGSVSLLM